MSLARKGELALAEDIRRRFSSRLPRGGVGIGDDAAVIASDPRKLLVSVDAMVEGVHFDLAFMSPRQLGYKLVAVNLSDIYAMCGAPRYIFLSVALPGNTKLKFIDSFFDGVEDCIKEHGVILAGGDLSGSPSGISASVTVMGYAKRPVLRSGAKAGHGICVTGTLGDSACGLEMLRRTGKRVDLNKGASHPYPWRLMGPLVGRHLMPRPKMPSGAIARNASSMMDISDGLALDLMRLTSANAVGALIEQDALPISPEMQEAAVRMGLDPLELALTGGEDYVILFTAPLSTMKGVRGVHEIGRVVPEEGIKMKLPGGRVRVLGPGGFDHFRGGENCIGNP